MRLRANCSADMAELESSSERLQSCFAVYNQTYNDLLMLQKKMSDNKILSDENKLKQLREDRVMVTLNSAVLKLTDLNSRLTNVNRNLFINIAILMRNTFENHVTDIIKSVQTSRDFCPNSLQPNQKMEIDDKRFVQSLAVIAKRSIFPRFFEVSVFFSRQKLYEKKFMHALL